MEIYFRRSEISFHRRTQYRIAMVFMNLLKISNLPVSRVRLKIYNQTLFEKIEHTRNRTALKSPLLLEKVSERCHVRIRDRHCDRWKAVDRGGGGSKGRERRNNYSMTEYAYRTGW